MAGLGIWRLCSGEDEDNKHLFYQCKYARYILKLICDLLKVHVPYLENTRDFVTWWNLKSSSYRNIPTLFQWAIWCDRNKWIFNEVRSCPMWTTTNILQNWERLRVVQKPSRDLSKRMRPVEIIYPVGFFDGASQLSSCGCGA